MAIHVNLSANNCNMSAVGGAVQVWKQTIDFSESGMDLAQNEIMAVAKIKAGMLLLAAQIEVITAQTDVTTVDLGYSTDGSTDHTLKQNGTLASTGYLAGYATPVSFTADNYVVFTNTDANTLNTGKIQISLVIADLR
jgi:hypothetical protein